MNKTAAKNILIFLMAFLGLGAIGGGAVLMISPSGALIGMPLSMLKDSPFNNFLIPGIILFSLLGLVPVLLAIALFKKPSCRLLEKLNCFNDLHWSWTYCVYVAFTLISWIQIQMIFLNAIHWLHSFYMFYAIAIIFVALLPQVRNLYRK